MRDRMLSLVPSFSFFPFRKKRKKKYYYNLLKKRHLNLITFQGNRKLRIKVIHLSVLYPKTLKNSFLKFICQVNKKYFLLIIIISLVVSKNPRLKFITK